MPAERLIKADEESTSVLYGKHLEELSRELDTDFVSGNGGGLGHYVGRYLDAMEEIIFSAEVCSFAVKICQNGKDFIEMTTSALPENPSGRFTTFVFEMDHGNGSPWPQPHGRFGIFLNDSKEPMVAFTNTKEARFWRRGEVTLYYCPFIRMIAPPGQAIFPDPSTSPDAWFLSGLCMLRVPNHQLTPGKPAKIRIEPKSDWHSTNWIRIGWKFSRNTYAAPIGPPCAGAGIVEAATKYAADSPRPEKHGYRVLFGDIHNHSGRKGRLVCGHGERRDLFEYARDISGLDFFCISEHDWQLTPENWLELQDLNDEYNEPGRFVTIHGYEYTGGRFGHRNVYFRDRGKPFIDAIAFGPNRPKEEAPSITDPVDLWTFLEENQIDAITIPHHFSTQCFANSFDLRFSEKYDRLAEVFSCWGNSLEENCPGSHQSLRVAELAGIHYLERGIPRFGFIGSSDSHDGCPGNANKMGGPLLNQLGSGRAVVLAREFTRDAIFDALKARRCYGTTSAHIVLWVTVGGHEMGAFVDPGEVPAPLVVAVEVSCPWTIEKIDIFRNGKRAQTVRPEDSMEATIEWTDPDYAPGSAANYFVRIVQADGQKAWSSPVWISEQGGSPD